MKRFIFFYTTVLLTSFTGYGHETLSLEDVWCLVIENHEEVKGLELDQYQSSLGVKRTIAEILPKVGANASLTYSNPSQKVDDSRIVPESFRAGSVGVSQSLVDFRFRPAFRGAKLVQEATCHQTEFQLYELLYQVSEAYLAVLQTQELVEVAKHQLDLSQHQLDVTKERYEAGQVPITDLLRTEEEVNQAARTAHDLETDLQIYADHLSNLASVDISACMLLLPKPRELECEEDVCTLVERAGCQRQDLQSLAAMIEAGKERVRILKRTNWPKVDFLGEYTVASPRTLSYRNRSWTAGFWLTMPLLDGGINRIDVKAAQAEVDKQQFLYERLAKDLSVQVKSAYFELKSARENFTLLKSALDLAKENYSILSERYERGQTSNIDLLDALNVYIQAQANYTNAQYTLVLLALKLKKETGCFGEFLKQNGVLLS